MIYSTPYMNGRAPTRGVFKAYVVFCSMSLFESFLVPLQEESQRFAFEFVEFCEK